MLYNEFIEGTGCKDNETNYRIYKDLEVMYMNSDLSKAQIYEYGKKLVDNSKSEAELEAEAKINAEIEELKQTVAERRERNDFLGREIERNKEYLKTEWDEYWIDWYKDNIKYMREEKRINNRIIRNLNSQIRMLKDW